MELTRKLLAEIRKISAKDLMSITLVGSFQHTKKLENVNDVDLIVLVKHLTPEVFDSINTQFKGLAKSLNSNQFEFVVENRIGPLKPNQINGKKVVQLHLLIYDLPIWKNASKFVSTRFDWTNFGTLIKGIHLNKVKPYRKIRKKDVVNNLETGLSNIKENSAYSRVYYNRNGKLETKKVKIKLSQEDRANSIYFNIITCFLNYARYFDSKIPKKKNILLKKAKRMLNNENYLILKKAFNIGKKAKQNKKLSLRDLKTFQEEAKIFMDSLLREMHHQNS